MSERKVPRMVPIVVASRESGVTYEAIRKLCLQKKIAFIKSGTKYLINMDKFIDFLNCEERNA